MFPFLCCSFLPNDCQNLLFLTYIQAGIKYFSKAIIFMIGIKENVSIFAVHFAKSCAKCSIERNDVVQEDYTLPSSRFIGKNGR